MFTSSSVWGQFLFLPPRVCKDFTDVHKHRKQNQLRTNTCRVFPLLAVDVKSRGADAKPRDEAAPEPTLALPRLLVPFLPAPACPWWNTPEMQWRDRTPVELQSSRIHPSGEQTLASMPRKKKLYRFYYLGSLKLFLKPTKTSKSPARNNENGL